MLCFLILLIFTNISYSAALVPDNPETHLFVFPKYYWADRVVQNSSQLKFCAALLENVTQTVPFFDLNRAIASLQNTLDIPVNPDPTIRPADSDAFIFVLVSKQIANRRRAFLPLTVFAKDDQADDAPIGLASVAKARQLYEYTVLDGGYPDDQSVLVQVDQRNFTVPQGSPLRALFVSDIAKTKKHKKTKAPKKMQNIAGAQQVHRDDQFKLMNRLSFSQCIQSASVRAAEAVDRLDQNLQRIQDYIQLDAAGEAHIPARTIWPRAVHQRSLALIQRARVHWHVLTQSSLFQYFNLHAPAPRDLIAPNAGARLSKVIQALGNTNRVLHSSFLSQLKGGKFHDYIFNARAFADNYQGGGILHNDLFQAYRGAPYDLPALLWDVTNRFVGTNPQFRSNVAGRRDIPMRANLRRERNAITSDVEQISSFLTLLEASLFSLNVLEQENVDFDASDIFICAQNIRQKLLSTYANALDTYPFEETLKPLSGLLNMIPPSLPKSSGNYSTRYYQEFALIAPHLIDLQINTPYTHALLNCHPARAVQMDPATQMQYLLSMYNVLSAEDQVRLARFTVLFHECFVNNIPTLSALCHSYIPSGVIPENIRQLHAIVDAFFHFAKDDFETKSYEDLSWRLRTNARMVFTTFANHVMSSYALLDPLYTEALSELNPLNMGHQLVPEHLELRIKMLIDILDRHNDLRFNLANNRIVHDIGDAILPNTGPVMQKLRRFLVRCANNPNFIAKIAHMVEHYPDLAHKVSKTSLIPAAEVPGLRQGIQNTHGVIQGLHAPSYLALPPAARVAHIRNSAKLLLHEMSLIFSIYEACYNDVDPNNLIATLPQAQPPQAEANLRQRLGNTRADLARIQDNMDQILRPAMNHAAAEYQRLENIAEPLRIEEMAKEQAFQAEQRGLDDLRVRRIALQDAQPALDLARQNAEDAMLQEADRLNNAVQAARDAVAPIAQAILDAGNNHPRVLQPLQDLVAQARDARDQNLLAHPQDQIDAAEQALLQAQNNLALHVQKPDNDQDRVAAQNALNQAQDHRNALIQARDDAATALHNAEGDLQRQEEQHNDELRNLEEERVAAQQRIDAALQARQLEQNKVDRAVEAAQANVQAVEGIEVQIQDKVAVVNPLEAQYQDAQRARQNAEGQTQRAHDNLRAAQDAYTAEDQQAQGVAAQIAQLEADLDQMMRQQKAVSEQEITQSHTRWLQELQAVNLHNHLPEDAVVAVNLFA